MPEYIFIYDHNLLRGQEDNDIDPTDAILYFYPTKTHVDIQHSLCSYVAGTCQILANILQSPPRYFIMEPNAAIACIHYPSNALLIQNNCSRSFTFALYSDNIDENQHQNLLLQRVQIIYESFIFYMNACLACIFPNGKRRFSKVIGNIIERLIVTVNNKTRLATLFQINPFCNNCANSSITHQLSKTVKLDISNLLNRVTHQINKTYKFIKVIGGCLFHKSELINSQLPINFINLFCLIIDSLKCGSNEGDIFQSIINNIVNIEQHKPRNGVYLFKACLTHKTYQELTQKHFKKKMKSKNNESNVELENSCCKDNHNQFILFYLEHHSETTVIFVIDEYDETKISAEILKDFSKLCFNELGEIEAKIWTGENDLESDDTIVEIVTKNKRSSTLSSKSSGSGSSGTNSLIKPVNIIEWNLVYNETNQDIKVLSNKNLTNPSNVTYQASKDWEENILNKTQCINNVLQCDPSIEELSIKYPKEMINVTRENNMTNYSIKKYN